MTFALGTVPATAAQARLPRNTDWLATVNWYRSSAGLPPVSENPAWTDGIRAHLAYLKNTPAKYMAGAYASAHTENPASPYYSAAGAREAGMSDLDYGTSTDEQAINNWMEAPFHAIGVLRPALQQVAFARDPTTGDAGLDVIQGLNPSTEPSSTSTLFPGPDSVIPLSSFGGESPDPTQTCHYVSGAGLPLIALLPAPASPTLTAHIEDGFGRRVPSCVVDARNFTSTDRIYGPAGEDILNGDNAVLIIPQSPLVQGRFTATIQQSGNADITWSFFEGGYAGEEIPASGFMRVHVSSVPGATVFGNLTVVDPTSSGYAAAYPCATGRTTGSNVNFTAHHTVANFAAVAADDLGDICIYTTSKAHLLWDQVAQTSTLTATNAIRLLDTRSN